MTTWQEYMKKEGRIPEWPYPIRYESEQEIDTDILVIGGGIAGCWAAISAARKGVRVTLLEKGATLRSGGGGTGCDHWHEPVTSPLSNVDPDERAQQLIDEDGGYQCGIVQEITCRESYDTLLELEKMGGKVRDYEDEYKGAQGRDDKTKFMLSPRFQPLNAVFRVWGTSFKPALKKECQRLGVKIYDRVMATSLLTESGIQGARVVGVTATNNRTGEFLVFKAKATILCTARNQAIWAFSSETTGIVTFRPRNVAGDGTAMAWRAGAMLTMMEGSSSVLNLGNGYSYPQYSEAGYASWENVPLVDSNGKKLPVPTQGWGEKDGVYATLGARAWRINSLREGVLKGQYTLPFYGDFPSMSEIERKATWNLMLTEEGKCKIMNQLFTEAGFDPSKDMPQNYWLIGVGGVPQWRSVDGGVAGGVHVDWDLRTTLDGLYCAGDLIYSCHYHSSAAASGRYAGRKAADYARHVDDPVISREQLVMEKARIYAPIKRSHGLEWKELHAGICRTMQNYCSEYKTETLLKMGLDSLRDIEENWVPKLFALDPHKLMRTLEDTSILTVAQIIIQASLVRKASSNFLQFHRLDYPEVDTPEWKKFVTVRLENNQVMPKLLPIDYWGPLKTNYEAHNKDYTGVFKG